MKVAEILLDHGFTDVIIFENPDYSEAFIGVTDDDRAVYDFDLMVKFMCEEHNVSTIEAIDI